MAVRHGYGKIVTDGLVLHLDAADRNSYPGSGTTWYDLSGNGSNGTLTNGPVFDSDNKGSIVFDGGNDYIEFGNINSSNILSLYNQNKFTISFWMNAAGIGDGFQRIIDKSDNPNATNGWCIIISSSSASTKRLAFFVNGGAAIDYTIDNLYLFNEWVNVVFTKNGNLYKLYTNGIFYNSNSSSRSYSAATTGCRIGSWNHSTGREFNGKLAMFGIYHKTLSDTEILQNYNASKTRFRSQ